MAGTRLFEAQGSRGFRRLTADFGKPPPASSYEKQQTSGENGEKRLDSISSFAHAFWGNGFEIFPQQGFEVEEGPLLPPHFQTNATNSRSARSEPPMI